MPFDPSFDDVYYVAIKAAAQMAGCTSVRVDHLMHGQDAVMETYRQIQRCEIVIADISTAEPDVLYELGYAHALGKPVVQLCSTNLENLPFMVRNRDTILYRAGQTHRLIDVLAEYVRHLLNITP